MASFVFTGDIGFDKHMTGRFADPELLSPEILDFFHSADHVVANVEGALTNAKDVHGKGFLFHAMDPKAASFLDNIHADVWSIANNHSMDAGIEGLQDTMALAKAHGAKTIGAGMNEVEAAKPVIFPEDGGVGIFACGYLPSCIPADAENGGNFCWDDFDRIAQTAKEIKKTCRHCILIVHGGEEFCAVPIDYIRERYHKYLDLGVDIVVAHHPHVVENYELLENGKAIFYSLGNFIFDTDYQRAQPDTDAGVLLRLDLKEDGFTFEPLPMQLIRGEERLVKADKLSPIFTNIGEKEYWDVLPLSCRAYLACEKRRRIFQRPNEYVDMTEEKWAEEFCMLRKGMKPGAHLDCTHHMKYAAMEGNADTMPAVKEYLEKELAFHNK